MLSIDGQLSPVNTINEPAPSGDQIYDDTTKEYVAGTGQRAPLDFSNYAFGENRDQVYRETSSPANVTGTSPSLQEILEQKYQLLKNQVSGEPKTSGAVDRFSNWLDQGNNALIAIAGFIFSLILIARLTK